MVLINIHLNTFICVATHITDRNYMYIMSDKLSTNTSVVVSQ